MLTANQALNGFIGLGVPQDWATHMIGHEITALHGVDHARSLAIIQPALLCNQFDSKKAKLEQMGVNVFGLAPGSNLAERTISKMEALYHSLGVETSLTQYSGSKSEAIEKILERLKNHYMVMLGESQAITLEKSREILELAVQD